jgi:CHAD domain-containing protein
MNPANPSAHFRSAASRLDRVLAHCAARPSEKPVHHLRTGIRRLEAALETLLQEPANAKGARQLHQSARSLDHLLHKIRRRAGVVRDADVHMEMLRELRRKALAGQLRGPVRAGASPHAGSAFLRECRALEAELAWRRAAAAGRLQHRAEKWQRRLQARVEAVLKADPPPSRSSQTVARNSAGEIALASFRRLCERMPQLDERNLHDFRKAARRARYQAETAADAGSRRIAAQWKRLQDKIGVWHDWLALAEQARAVMHAASPLVRRLESLRDRRYRDALRAARRARTRLLEGGHRTEAAGTVRRSAA